MRKLHLAVEKVKVCAPDGGNQQLHEERVDAVRKVRDEGPIPSIVRVDPVFAQVPPCAPVSVLHGGCTDAL